MIRWLIAAVLCAGTLIGAEVPADGSTPLHMAVYQDDVATVKKLLAAGANAKAANRYGITPLTLACTNGNASIVELLLAAGADPNTLIPSGETALMTAARTGKPEAIASLIARGANPHAKEPVANQTALMWAAAEGHAAAISVLLKAGAEINGRSKAGFTPLLFAVREGRIPAVQTLLKAGASVNEAIQSEARSGGGVRGVPVNGSSALMLAVINGHFELASILLDAGADPSPIATGWTPLHAITQVRKPGLGDNDPSPIGSGNITSIQLVRKLAAKGANLNARMTRKINVGLTGLNTNGATPYLLAARSADAELMRLLVELGADPKIPNVDGANAIIVAAGLGTRSPGEDAGTEEEVIEALELVLSHGLDINSVDQNGETVMHGAAYKNYPEAVRFLANKGADIKIWNRKNKYGWTPLVIAMGYRFGNFKPSQVTVAAFHEIMKAAGVSLEVEIPKIYRDWQ